MNNKLISIINILNEILEKPEKRVNNINRFQKLIWNADKSFVENDLLWENMRNLALDLDYYEPDENVRNKNSSYYDEIRLKKEILSILSNINVSLGDG